MHKGRKLYKLSYIKWCSPLKSKLAIVRFCNPHGVLLASGFLAVNLAVTQDELRYAFARNFAPLTFTLCPTLSQPFGSAAK